MKKIIFLLFCTSLLKIHAQIFTQSSTNGAITITPNGLRGNGNSSNNTLNVSLGMNSLFSNSTGNENTAIGGNALASSVNGFENTAIGSKSMQFLTGTAHYNTAIGAGSMAENPLSVDGNTGVGRWALNKIQTGCCNTAVGEGALSSDVSGASNVAIGSQALNNLINTNGNTAVGVSSLYQNLGASNTALGNNSLSSNTTGTLNIAIGANSNVSSNNLTNAIVIGSNAVVNASNKIRLGNSNITVIEGQVAYSYPSDGRFKNNIIEDVKGLEFITKLRPVSYHFDTEGFERFTNNGVSNNIDYSVSKSIKHNGFIAQEVEKVINEIGFDFDGISVPKDKNQTYSLSYSQSGFVHKKRWGFKKLIYLFYESKINL
jgi:trimeric autotransporter adhesin